MKDDPVDRLVRLGFVVSGIIALTIVGGVIVLAFLGAIYGSDVVKIPSVLENWGGVVVGFYFGTFVSLIKDYMRLRNVGTVEPAPAPPSGEPPPAGGAD